MEDTQWIMAMFTFLVHFKWRKTLEVPSWQHLQRLFFYVRVTVHRNKFLYNKTNYMH